jgi:peptidoglycan/xylan/chitin deacetylase (PgdA/CDA1 family)
VARLFSGARSIAYWSALRTVGWLPISDHPLVLCYHAIEDQSDDPVLAPYGVPPHQFTEQLESLARRGFQFISPGQLAAHLEAGAPLPRRPVLLTFDDGYADLVDAARTLLQPKEIEGLVFVVTGAESGTNEWDQPYGAKVQRLLTGEQRAELQTLGIEVGSHSRSHREMPKLDAAELTQEAAGSREDLLASGLHPRFFAYPYGALDETAKRAVKAAGFAAAFGTRHRRIHPGDDRFNLPRVIILSTDRSWRFWMKTTAPRLWDAHERARRQLAAGLKRIRT